jgi:IS30 family transposase
VYPYNYCERGTNKSHNRTIRRYIILKGTSIDACDCRFIEQVSDKMNQRPCKILNYQTLASCFEQLLSLFDNELPTP